METLYTPENFFCVGAINPIEMQDLTEEWDNESVEPIPSIEAAEPMSIDTSEPKPSIKTEENDGQRGWSELPSLPFERIYSYLSRADQINLSQVCRKWSEGYASPSVWKTFRFYLTDSELSLDTCPPEIKFARKFSCMFRHVEIVCRRINLQLIDTSWRNLKIFLHILTNDSQLLSIKFRNLGNYLRQLDSPVYDDIFRTMANFLESQQNLKRVEFHECFFQFQEAVELLKVITENSRESLTHLVLRGFVHNEQFQEEDSNVAQNLPAFLSQRFPMLTTLETDYSAIFDNMFSRQSADVETLKNFQMRKLSKIVLHCDGFRQERFRGLTSTTWRFLKQLRPDLQVELYLMPNSQTRREVELFIQPEMPITLLDYRLDRLQASSIIEIDVLCNHILACRVNEHLVSLYIVWMMPIHDLASTFIPFLQACTKLKCLQLFTMYPANGIDLLVRSWLENRPESLKEAMISISNVRNEDDYMSLMTLADEYVPLLQVIGLNAFVIVDYGWR